MKINEIFKYAYDRLGRGVVIQKHDGERIHARLVKIILSPAPCHIAYVDSEGFNNAINILEIERID